MTPSTHGRRTAVLILAVALAAGACSGDDGATLDLGEATTTVAVPEPTVPSTPAPTTTAAPTTTSTVAQSTTTTTEPEPELSLEDQIRADFARMIDLRLACGREPETCPIGEITFPGSEAERYLTELMATRVEHSLQSREGHGEFRYVVEDLELDADLSHVTTCQIDSIVLYDTSQGRDIIFDESVVSARTRWTLALDSGKWKWKSSRALAEVLGDSLCGG